MPCYVRVSRCPKGHELTVYIDPQAGDVIEVRWSCESCEAEGQTAGERSAPEPQGYSALAEAGAIKDDMVSQAKRGRVSKVRRCLPGCLCAKHDPTPFIGNPNWDAEFDAKRRRRLGQTMNEPRSDQV